MTSEVENSLSVLTVGGAEGKPTRADVIALLKEMPADVNPFEYLDNLKKTLYRNTAEEALSSILLKDSMAKAKFDLKHGPPKRLKGVSLPYQGGRFLSKSVPSTPSKPSRARKKGRKEEDEDEEQPRVKKSNNNNNNKEEKALEPLKPSLDLLQEGASCEKAFIQIKGVISYFKNLKAPPKTRIKPGDLIRESFYLLRRLCKATVEFFKATKFTLSKLHRNDLLQGVSLISKIYQNWSEEPEFEDLFSTSDTGIGYLVDNVINSLAEDCPDALTSLQRGNLAHEIFDRLKPLKIRHYIFEKLCQALRVILLYGISPLSQRSGRAGVIEYADINRSFRYLQLTEFILFTTASLNQGPWLEKSEVQALNNIQKKLSKDRIQYANVAMFLSRIIFMASKYLKPEPIQTKK